MKTFLLLLLAATPGISQPEFTIGGAGGVPITDTFDGNQHGGLHGSFSGHSATRRYVVGALAGVSLSSHLAVEAGLQYRRFGYDYQVEPLADPFSFTAVRGTGAAWEVPVVAKWRVFPKRAVTPVAGLGATYRRLADLNEVATVYNNFYFNNPQQTRLLASDHPALLKDRNAVAPTVVGGVAFRVHRMIVTPGIRYSLWFSDTLGNFGDPVRWHRKQLDFLLEIGLPLGRRGKASP